MGNVMKLSDLEIRTGGDGKQGIYLRAYNVRLATFNANTRSLQKLLADLIKRASREPKAARVRRFGGKPVDAISATLAVRNPGEGADR